MLHEQQIFPSPERAWRPVDAEDLALAGEIAMHDAGDAVNTLTGLAHRDDESRIAFGHPDRCDLVVSDILPSTASRLSPFDADGVAGNQHVSTRSTTSLHLDPKTLRVIVAESTNESKALIAFQVDRNVVLVEDQPAAVRFLDGLGAERWHTFDFRVTLLCGTSIAVFVKPKELVDRPDTQDLLHNLANQLPPDFASSILVLTEQDFPAWHLDNLNLLLSVRADPWTHVHDLVKQTVLQLTGPISVGELLAELGGGAIAFRPVARMLDEGLIEQVEPGRFNRRSIVRLKPEGATS